MCELKSNKKTLDKLEKEDERVEAWYKELDDGLNLSHSNNTFLYNQIYVKYRRSESFCEIKLEKSDALSRKRLVTVVKTP